MKKSSILPRFLARAVIGSLVVLMMVPWARVGSIQLVLQFAKYQLGKDIPGPALTRLLQVDAWSAKYPPFHAPVQRDKALCYAQLGDIETALQVAQQALQGAPEPPDRPEMKLRSLLLFFPDKAANWLLAKRYPEDPNAAAMPLAMLGEACRARGDETSAARIRQQLPARVVQTPGDTTAMPTLPTADVPLPRRQVDLNAEWGVTSVESARAYSRDGKFLGRLPAGTPVEVTDIRQSKKGDLSECTLGSSVAGMPAQVLLRSRDLTTWRGALADVSPQERQLRASQASIQATIASRVDALAENHAKRNPNQQSYQTALTEYRALYKRSTELTKLRDSSTGVKRQQAANELKQMKGKAAAVARKYEAVKIEYETWKRNNPPPLPDDDQTIHRLRKRHESINAEIRRLDA